MRTHLMSLGIAFLAMSMQLPAQEVSRAQEMSRRKNGWNGLKKPNWVFSFTGVFMP